MKNNEDRWIDELVEMPKFKLSDKVKRDMLSQIKYRTAKLERRKRITKRIVNSSAVSAAILLLAFLFFTPTGEEWKTGLTDKILMNTSDSDLARDVADGDELAGEGGVVGEAESPAEPPQTGERVDDGYAEDTNFESPAAEPDLARRSISLARWNPEQADFEASMLAYAKDILDSIKSQQMDLLAQVVHPTQGLLFSPYAHIDFMVDQLFLTDEVYNLLEEQTVYTWGYQHGSGNPIELTPAEYWKQYVYDHDFLLQSDIVFNERAAGHGGTINNIDEMYPDSIFVEFHYEGSEEWSYMDWVSLRLVFEEQNGFAYLVAIVHDQWSP